MRLNTSEFGLILYRQIVIFKDVLNEICEKRMYLDYLKINSYLKNGRDLHMADFLRNIVKLREVCREQSRFSFA